jgi:hypothetical protein
VDFAHNFNDYLLGKMEENEEGKNKWLVGLLVGTILFFAISLVFLANLRVVK